MSSEKPGPAAIISSRCATRERGWYTVETTLDHFATITYAVPPERVRPLIHPDFELHTVSIDDDERALLSVVAFVDRDFRFRRLPWARWSFGQTNYRIYVRYQGQECAWFLGTTLASRFVAVPRYLWRLPWHAARTTIDARYDAAAARYEHYSLTTRSAWAAAELTLDDTGQSADLLPGFPDLDTQRLVLTHPVAGYYWRTDGRLGSYRIWHDRIHQTVGQARHARFGLLERLGIVGADEASRPHSVLIQREVPFEIYLPPRIVYNRLHP